MSIKYKSNKIQILIIGLVCNVLIYLWYRNNAVFAGSEEGIPFYDLNRTSKVFSYLWKDMGAGFPGSNSLMRAPTFFILSILQLSGLSSWVIQSFLLFILMFAGSLAVYFMLNETISTEIKNKYIPLLGAIFYLLNPYSMTQVWGRALYIQFFAFTLIPLTVFLIIRAVSHQSVIYSLLIVLVSAVLSETYAHVSYVLTYWGMFGIVLLYYYIFQKEKRKFVIVFFFLSMFVWSFVHAWWLAPLLFVENPQIAHSLQNSSENLGILKGVSEQFPLSYTIRLMHKMYFNAWYFEYYGNLFVKMCTWFAPISVLLSLKYYKKQKYYQLFAFIFLVSLFIVLGSNWPFGGIFTFFFERIKFLQAFRNPYEKFGIFYMLAFTLLFSIGFSWFIKRIGYLKAIIIFIILTLVTLKPIWTREFCGGINFNCWITVPEEYSQVNEWLITHASNSRVIHLPLAPWDGIKYLWGKGDYQGVEPSIFLFENSSISVNVPSNKEYYNVLLQRFDSFYPNSFGPDPDISQSEFKSETFVEELEKLNVRYIVLHNDIEPKISGTQEPEAIREYLSNQENIDKVGSFGKLDLYEVKLNPMVAMIYSNENEVEFAKINPAFYKFRTTNLKDEFKLNFLNLYDQGWELTINGEVITDHQKLFSYANSWTIVKSGEISGEIKYKPQDKVILGSKISILSLTFVVALLFVFRNKIVAKS